MEDIPHAFKSLTLRRSVKFCSLRTHKFTSVGRGGHVKHSFLIVQMQISIWPLEFVHFASYTTYQESLLCNGLTGLQRMKILNNSVVPIAPPMILLR